MAFLKNGISVQCRTQEEADVFFEVAQKEHWLWNGSDDMANRGQTVPISFQLGYHKKGRVTWGSVYNNYSTSIYGEFVNVEASQLFRNLLISRRAKHGTD